MSEKSEKGREREIEKILSNEIFVPMNRLIYGLINLWLLPFFCINYTNFEKKKKIGAWKKSNLNGIFLFLLRELGLSNLDMWCKKKLIGCFIKYCKYKNKTGKKTILFFWENLARPMMCGVIWRIVQLQWSHISKFINR